VTLAALVARPLAPSDNNAWDTLALRHGCIFDSRSWTDLSGNSLNRFGIYDRGGVLRGGFCTWGGRRLWLIVVRNPPYTPRIGPFFESRATNPAARTNEQRAMVEAVAKCLTSSGAAVTSLGLSMGITDCLPFFWRGWRVIPHYTYRINLGQDQNVLLAAMSPERRKNVRKAESDGVSVEAVVDTRAVRRLVIGTFARQKRAFPVPHMEAIFSQFPPGESSYCFVASSDGKPVAAVYVVYDSRAAYYLIGGYADDAHHGAGALAMWHAILKAKALGLETFDFEGSVVPQIERYFRGFGGQLTPVFGVYRGWLPIEIGLKLLPKYRNRF